MISFTKAFPLTSVVTLQLLKIISSYPVKKIILCCTKWASLIYEKFSSPPAVAVQRMGNHQSLSRSFSIYYQTAAPNKISYRNVKFPLCIMKCTHVKCESSLFWSRKLQTQNTRIFWKKNTHGFPEIFFMVSCIPVPPLNSILKEKDIFSLLQKNGSPEYWTVVPSLKSVHPCQEEGRKIYDSCSSGKATVTWLFSQWQLPLSLWYCMRNPVLATQHGYTEFMLTRAGPRHWFLDLIQASLRLQIWISNSEFIRMHKSKSILEVSHVKKKKIEIKFFWNYIISVIAV